MESITKGEDGIFHVTTAKGEFRVLTSGLIRQARPHQIIFSRFFHDWVWALAWDINRP